MKKGNNILVIGDLMIDEWVYGDVDRLSPEAPIPIVDVKEKTETLGGAGNVLVNLKALNSYPIIISGISYTNGERTKELVNEVCDKHYYFGIPLSFNKQRICGSNQQIVRIDTGEGRDISDTEIDNFLTLAEEDNYIDAVLVADYGKGAITETVLSKVSDFCSKSNIPFLIDPYLKDYYYCKKLKCSLIKFNRSEAENFTNIRINNDDNLKETARIIMDKFDTESILITLGPDGMVYFDKKDYKEKPFKVIDNPLHVYDVCGAGDVVFAVLGKLMAERVHEIHNMEAVIRFAAKAGRLAVSKKGTSVVTYDEIFN